MNYSFPTREKPSIIHLLLVKVPYSLFMGAKPRELVCDLYKIDIFFYQHFNTFAYSEILRTKTDPDPDPTKLIK